MNSRLTPTLFQVEVTTFALAYFRRSVFSYQIGPTSMERTAPVALIPADFVHEWLEMPWHEASRWSKEGGRKFLSEWWEQFKNRSVGEFRNHYRCDDGLWQIDFEEYENGSSEEFVGRFRLGQLAK